MTGDGKAIPAADAYDHVAGFCVMNDVSGRDAQFGDGQWFRGKSFDTFAPLGPCLVTREEIGDVENLRLTAHLDGTLMQEGNTRDLIFKIPFVIEYISRDMTLMPGDIISTGTPSGVGIFRDPPILLQPGSVIRCEIEKIGVNPKQGGIGLQLLGQYLPSAYATHPPISTSSRSNSVRLKGTRSSWWSDLKIKIC